MNSQTEALMSLMLLEDTLDREVERREEELVWERRKLVYLEALGCADITVLDGLQTVTKRSEAVIETLKNLLKKTYKERKMLAEKVESNIPTSPFICSTISGCLDEPIEYSVNDSLPNSLRLKRKSTHKLKSHWTERKLHKIFRRSPNKRNRGPFHRNTSGMWIPNSGCSGASPNLNALTPNMPKQQLPNTPSAPSLSHITQSSAEQQTCDLCRTGFIQHNKCLSCGADSIQCLLPVFRNQPNESLEINVDHHLHQQESFSYVSRALPEYNDTSSPGIFPEPEEEMRVG